MNKCRRVVYYKRDLIVFVINIKKYIDGEIIVNYFFKFGEVDRVILVKGDEDFNSYYVIFLIMFGVTKVFEE